MPRPPSERQTELAPLGETAAGKVGEMDGQSVIEWAAWEAERLLAPLGLRWVHSKGVAERARQVVAWTSAVDGAALVAAAYLHDVGHAPALRDTAHHGIDGARYLSTLGRPRLAALVAHHSGSAHEAAALGLTRQLQAFTPEASATADALTYCDLTADLSGHTVTLEERVADVRRRYGDTHIVALSMESALDELRQAVQATERLLTYPSERQAMTG